MLKRLFYKSPVSPRYTVMKGSGDLMKDDADVGLVEDLRDNWSFKTVMEVLQALSFEDGPDGSECDWALGLCMDGGKGEDLFAEILDAQRYGDSLIGFVEFLQWLHDESQGCAWVAPADFGTDSTMGLMYSRYGALWSKKHRASRNDLMDLCFPRDESVLETLPDFVNFLPGTSQELVFDMNHPSEDDRMESSDFWKEEAARRIDYHISGFSGTYERHNEFTDLLSHLVNCPMPKVLYPGYYDLLCGKSMERADSITFTFVAKYMDCSSDGLMAVARRCMDNVVFDDFGLDHEVDVDSLEIVDVGYETLDYAKMMDGYQSEGLEWKAPKYYDEDLDYPADGAGDPLLTLVHFTCRFTHRIRIACPTNFEKDVCRYEFGDQLNDDEKDLLQHLRNVFEHPLRICLKGEWLVSVPTLESLRRLETKIMFGGLWSSDRIMKFLLEMGSERERALLKPLVVFLDESDAHGWYFFPEAILLDSAGFKGVAEHILEYIRGVKVWMGRIGLVWNEVRTPGLLAKKIAKMVDVDPLLYVDCTNRTIAEYARRLVG